nr:hypothetical protein [Tanacetum cinerariifolium]
GAAHGPGRAAVSARLTLVAHRDSDHSGLDFGGRAAASAHRPEHQPDDAVGAVAGHRHSGRPGYGGRSRRRPARSAARRHARRARHRFRARQAGVFADCRPPAGAPGAGASHLRRGVRGAHWGLLFLYRAGHDA